MDRFKKILKSCCIGLWLTTSAPAIAMHNTAQAIPQEDTEASLILHVGKKGELAIQITQEEKALLHTYLHTASSDKLLAGLIEAVCTSETSVSSAAYRVIERVLKHTPTLANAKALQYTKRFMGQAAYDWQSGQGTALLTLLVKCNAKLAPAVWKATLALIHKEAIQKKTTSTQPNAAPQLSLLYRSIVEARPACAKTMLEAAHQDALGDSEGEKNVHYRVQLLHMVSSIVDKPPIQSNTKNLDTVFNITARNNRDYDMEVRAANTHLFSTLIGANAAYTQQLWDSAVKSTQAEDSYERAATLNTLDLFARADTSYTEKVLQIAARAIQDEQRKVRHATLATFGAIADMGEPYTQKVVKVFTKALGRDKEDSVTDVAILRMLAIIVSRNKQYAQDVLMPVINSVLHYKYEEGAVIALRTLLAIVKSDPQCAPEAYKTVLKVVRHKDERIRWTALQVLTPIVKADAAYSAETYKIAAEAIKDNDKDVRCHALLLLATVVRSNPQYSREALPVAIQAFQDKYPASRENVFHVLAAIIQADAQYVPEVYNVVIQAIKDKAPEVRQQAMAMLYIILNMAPHYRESQELVDILQAARLDKDEEVRESAQVFIKYCKPRRTGQ